MLPILKTVMMFIITMFSYYEVQKNITLECLIGYDLCKLYHLDTSLKISILNINFYSDAIISIII